jgi:hypothetical protein
MSCTLWEQAHELEVGKMPGSWEGVRSLVVWLRKYGDTKVSGLRIRCVIQ